jgi:hypothetical protein
MRRRSGGAVHNSKEVPQNRKIKLPYNLALPFLGIHLKTLKSRSQRDMTTVFNAVLFIKPRRRPNLNAYQQINGWSDLRHCVDTQ